MISLESVLKSKIEFKGSFIAGKWSQPGGVKASFGVKSPANFDWTLPDIEFAFPQIDEALQVAKQAQKLWSKLPVEKRIAALKRFGEELGKRKEHIARLIAIETGKVFDEALVEAGALTSKIQITIDEGLQLVTTRKLDLGAGQGQGEIHYRPKGVLVVIGPFNFPVHLNNGHIIPALLCGNAVIVKPSEKAPYSSQAYFEAAEAAEFPPGLLQLLHGNGEFATRLIRRPEIDGVLATCSYEVGAKIQKELAEAPEKIIALEMGGKNACIVWKGANVDQVASDLIKSAFLTTGQRCSALSRAYVHPSLIETLADKVHTLAKELTIHHPFHDDPKPFMGPIISAQAQANFLRYGKIAESEGATAIMRGKPLEGSARMSRTPLPEGCYVTPSIHMVPKWDLKSVYQNHEIFGPDLFFAPVETLEEAVRAANSTQYGLTFSMFGGTQAEFQEVADDIEAGCVYWNRPTVGASSRLPFGGWKRSGNHRPAGVFSVYYTTQVQARIL